MIRWVELAVVGTLGEKAALKRQKGNSKEKSRKCGCAVAQYIKPLLEL